MSREDSPCPDLSSHDDVHPDSAGSQGEQIGSSLLSKNKRTMAKEDRPSQSSAILDGQHDKGAGVVTSLNEAMIIRPLAIEKDRIVEILSSPRLASRDPMHGIFTEPPFDIVREGTNIIHTSHGVKEGDEPISANVKRENVGSILKPMSSAGSTNEVAKGLGIADTPPSTAIDSDQGASFVPMSLEGNPWLAVESTFQNNTTENVYREPTRMFAKSILSNAVKTVTSSNLEEVSSYFGIVKMALRNAWEVGLDTSMVESIFGAIFEIATKYSEALKVNSHELLEKELRASLVTYQTPLDEVLTPYESQFEQQLEKLRSLQLLLGSQELPASDVERSIRCQALCANGEKKHLNVEKARSKLLPASTMLVNEVGAFDMEDDNPKGGDSIQSGAGGYNPQVQGRLHASAGGLVNLGVRAYGGSNINLGTHHHHHYYGTNHQHYYGTRSRPEKKRRDKEDDDVWI